MNKGKILILLILFVAVSGITISSVSAKTYTETVKFKEHTSDYVSKHIGNRDYISTFYNSKYSAQLEKNRAMLITIGKIHDKSNNHNIINAKIKFIKKTNEKTQTMTKNYKSNKWGFIDTQAPIGWTPHSAIVKYKDEKSLTNKITWNYNGGKIDKTTKKATYLNKGDEIKMPTTPKRSGYKFKGWYTKKDGGKKITKDTKPTKNVIYYAQWTKYKSKESKKEESQVNTNKVQTNREKAQVNIDKAKVDAVERQKQAQENKKLQEAATRANIESAIKQTEEKRRLKEELQKQAEEAKKLQEEASKANINNIIQNHKNLVNI
jgi:uncharacterized repeat protein (TIGR02543 family)